jgi:ABC-type amino acid transport substrate-binding protein
MRLLPAALMVLAACSAHAEDVQVGLFAVAPYVLRDGAQPSGALISFFDQEIAPRMGVRFIWQPPVTIARLEQNLVSGAIQFTPILSVTPDRRDRGIVFAGDQYVRFAPCVAVLPESPLQAIRSPRDLYGMSIGWATGGAIASFMLDPGIRLERVGVVDWERTNLEKLRLGRLHGAFFSDEYTPLYYARHEKMQLRCVKIPAPGVTLHGAFAPGTAPGLIQRYEKAAREAFANGRFTAFVEKYISSR